MLELFKQEKSFLTRAKEKRLLKYVIQFDEIGAYLEVCDGKLELIKDIDFRVYNGLDREILQYVEKVNEDDFFSINWESAKNHLYLSKHPRLLELLYLKKTVYSHNGEEILFENDVYVVDFFITKKVIQ